MPSFEESRIAYTGARQQAQATDAQVRSLKGQLELQRRALTQLMRSFSPDNAAQAAKRARLEGQIKALEGQLSRAARSLQGAQQAAREAWQVFATFTDPQKAITQWRDDRPILLFPVRLETRFKTVNGSPQLWVRIYPDECLVDLFHEQPTDMEAQALQAFWAQVWVAGGDEAAERAAWAGLVGAIGTGRAGWLVQHYQPENPGDKPVKAQPEDILLALPAETAVPPALLIYWRSLWQAGDQAAAQQAAYDALVAALGPDESAEWLKEGPPQGFSQEPAAGYDRTDLSVSVHVLRFPDAQAADLRPTSWTDAPRVKLLPDRFVFMGYRGETVELTHIGHPVQSPLQVGIDPLAPPADQLGKDEGEITWPEGMKWMADFPSAVATGMGMQIPLTTQQARAGFDRVLVVGIRSSSDAQAGRQELEDLLLHHLYSKKNLSIVPQGTPTNNTEQADSGYRFLDDPDESFDLFFRRTPAYTPQSQARLKADGQWLAEALGLSEDLARFIPNAETTDQAEALDMNTALWEGTLGYWMKSEMAPLFSQATIRQTRRFFTQYVTGRGRIPALRIGKQPYGILPCTAFRQGVNWFPGRPAGTAPGPGPDPDYLRSLYELYQLVDGDTDAWVDRIARVGQGSDAHQTLLDVLGLHPASVEYFPLLGEDPAVKFNELKISSLTIAILYAIAVAASQEAARQFLQAKGAEVGDILPKILQKVYSNRLQPLTGPVIDDVPLSERDPVRPYAGPLNYLEWLVQAAETSLDALRAERGFDNNRRPQALLYLLLRHALQLGFDDSGKSLVLNDRLPYTAQFLEPTYLHVQEKAASQSRYSLLYQAHPQVNNGQVMLADFIAQTIRTAGSDLSAALHAIERLAQVPTARLERAFAEHLDLLTYRFDAWKQGLIAWKLENLRTPNANEANDGLYLGAFAWLEPLRPEGRSLSPAQVPAAYASDINKGQTAPLMTDSRNAGAIHAPSLDHATTAAVLRNGYLNGDGRLAVGLASSRVRQALAIIEGIRNGQSLGALLGYYLERHIQEDTDLRTRPAIYALRKRFPLVADRIRRTQAEAGDPIEAIAAANVVDGQRLLRQVERSGVKTYPFGLTTFENLTSAQQARVNTGVDLIMDLNDAVADLALAEGVHQAVKGNYERSAGTLDAFARGELPPEPEVVQTPRKGRTLTHRVALHLSPTVPPNPWPAVTLGSRAQAEPRLNAWLAQHLPAPTAVAIRVAYHRATDGAAMTADFTLAQLGLQPLDLLHLGAASTGRNLDPLDEMLLARVYARTDVSLRHPVTIRYTERIPGQLNWFQLTALIEPLKQLLASRPLQPSDLRIHHEARTSEEGAIFLPEAPILQARSDLDTYRAALTTLMTTLADAALAIDDQLAAFAQTMLGAQYFAEKGSGGGEGWLWRQGQVEALRQTLASLLDTWQLRRDQARGLLDAYDADPGLPEAEARNLLRNAEILVSASFAVPEPPLAGHRLAVEGKWAAFELKLQTLQGLHDAHPTRFQDFLQDFQAELPLDSFQNEPFDLARFAEAIASYRNELLGKVQAHHASLGRVLDQVDDRLAQANAATGPKQVKLRQEAVKALFGEDFFLVPQTLLPDSLAGEVQQAWTHAQGPDFLAHAHSLGYIDPAAEWLHGIARVREKMALAEQCLMVGEALALNPLAVAPMQLPFAASRPWFALAYPDAQAPDQDQLLYTQIGSSGPVDTTLYGLLLDEWTEVIPEREETTGIAFHFDRPNSEAPQAMLLVMAAQQNGRWTWEELVAALDDTLLSAKKRALEPVHQDATPYAHFLPATVASYTYPELNIALPFHRMQGIYDRFTSE